MWTYVGKKQSRLTVDEKQERYDAGDIYLWTAIDQTTKLVPTFALGKRSADSAARRPQWPRS
jgi:IS1 family transposase